MIDYEKLRLAHELADKFYEKSGSSVVIEHNFEYGCTAEYVHGLWINQGLSTFNDIDELITKLQTLTEPEPKYKIGDEVWFASRRNIICKSIVKKINKGHGVSYYFDDEFHMFESDLYPTKSQLIEAQMAYWTDLQAREFENEITKEPETEPSLTITEEGCPSCGNDMNDYSVKIKNGLWRRGCTARCGYYYDHEYRKVSGAKLGKSEECEVIAFEHCAICCEPIGCCDCKECQHESDGEDYRYQYAHHYKCTKCGEFYR